MENRGLRVVLLVVPALIVMTTIAAVVSNHHVLPYMDYWAGAIDYMHISLGQPFDLFMFHNEHRIPIMRLLMLADYVLFSGFGWLPVVASLVAAAVTAWIIARLTTAFAATAVVSLVFCAVQLENLAEPFQFTFVSVFTSAFASIYLFARAEGRLWPNGAGALAMYVLAAYSLASGLLVGPVLVVMALRTRSWALAVVTAITTCAVVVVYVHGYVQPAQHPSFLLSLQHPLRVTFFAASELGSVVKALGVEQSIRLGMAGIALSLAVMFKTWRAPSATSIALTGMMIFVMATAALTAIGRSGFGIDLALSDRYTTIGCMFWAVQAAYWGRSIMPQHAAVVSASAIAVAGYAHWNGLASLEPRRMPIAWAADAYMVGVRDKAVLKLDFPDVPSVEEWANFLAFDNLSVFASSIAGTVGKPIEANFVTIHPSACAGHIDHVEPADGAAGDRVSGWAWNRIRLHEPAKIILTDEAGTIIGLASTETNRPDALAAVRIAIDPSAGNWSVFEPRLGWQGLARFHHGLLRAYVQTGAKSVCEIGRI